MWGEAINVGGCSEPVLWLLSLSLDQCMTSPCPSPCGNPHVGVTRAGGLLYAAGHREIMAIPPQLAYTIKARGGSEDSSFNQAIVWANYIWMQDPKNPPPPLSKTCTEYPKQLFRDKGECTDTGRAQKNINPGLLHYPYPSPAGSHQSVVCLSHTHMWHSALDQISACCSQKRWGGLRGLTLNRKHTEEPFPSAPP